MEQKINRSEIIKRVIQFILCTTLVVIDVARNFGGWQMMLASQAIGLILGGIIILHYGPKKFLKPYHLVWPILCCITIMVMHIPSVRGLIPWYSWYEAWLAAFNICLFGMIITSLLIDVIKDKKVHSRKKVSLLLIIWLAYILLATIVPDNTFRPGFYLLYFSVFYFIPFSRKESEELAEDLTNGVIAGFWFFQIIAFFVRPYVQELERYQGMYYNSNTYDLMCLVVMIFILVKATKARRTHKVRSWNYIFWLIQYAVVFSLIVLSVGRASIVLAVTGTVFYGIIVLLIFDKLSFKKVTATIGMLLMITILAFPVTFTCASYLPRILKRPVSFQDEYYKWGDLNAEENYVSFGQVLELTFGRFATLFFDYQEVEINQEGLAERDELPMDPNWETATYYYDEDDYNSTDLRIAIWRTYTDNLNMWGHKAAEWGVWVAPHEYIMHAHNIYIMQAYVYGIPAGILFIGWTILYLIQAWKYMLVNRKKELAFLPLLFMILLIGYGMFDLNCMYGQISWAVVLFLQKLLINKNDSVNI